MGPDIPEISWNFFSRCLILVWMKMKEQIGSQEKVYFLFRAILFGLKGKRKIIPNNLMN